MDARANEIQHEANEAATLPPSPRLMPVTDDTDKASMTTLAIAKYLPVHVFKNSRTLMHELDMLEIEVNSINNQSRQHMLNNLAKNIALTTLELNTDYGTKLNLIEAALSHPIFQPKGFATRVINFIANRFRKRNISRTPCTEAQAILCNAIGDIRKNRNTIILC